MLETSQSAVKQRIVPMKTNSPRPANRMPERFPWKNPPAVKQSGYPAVRPKSMTIAIGLLCRDGIVMGADSQSGIAGSLKWPTQKILPITIGTHGNESTVNSAAIAVAGAGNTHYFQEMQELSARLIEVPDSANTIEEKLRSKFRDFYAETILPFSG